MTLHLKTKAKPSYSLMIQGRSFSLWVSAFKSFALDALVGISKVILYFWVLSCLYSFFYDWPFFDFSCVLLTFCPSVLVLVKKSSMTPLWCGTMYGRLGDCLRQTRWVFMDIIFCLVQLCNGMSKCELPPDPQPITQLVLLVVLSVAGEMLHYTYFHLGIMFYRLLHSFKEDQAFNSIWLSWVTS